MADKMTPEQRHKCMSRIRSKNTRPELLVRRYLYAHGFRYRLHSPRLPGHPDIVIRRLATVILVNGCFWHGHEGCPLYTVPKSNTAFWQAKVARNRERDQQERQQLTALGWNVIQIWECQLKPLVRERTLQSLVYTLSRIELDRSASRYITLPAARSDYAYDDERISMVADEGF